MTASIALICKVLFLSISTFETPPIRHLFFVFERVCEERQVTSSIRTPASSLERTIARCAGCFWEIRVTCRPRWGATRAEKRGTRRLGRLPMRNVSRQGEARQDKVANSLIGKPLV